MNKKYILLGTLLIILLIALLFIFKGSSHVDDELISKLKAEANLDLITNLGTFSKDDFQDSKLLCVAMQIAEKNNLLSERSGDAYVQYISESDLHSLIYELTGITVSAPIQIEDFYYIYDGENECYYCRPISPQNTNIKEIQSISESNSEYIIKCSTTSIIDTEEIVNENVKISLTYMPENSIVKYKVNYVEM